MKKAILVIMILVFGAMLCNARAEDSASGPDNTIAGGAQDTVQPEYFDSHRRSAMEEMDKMNTINDRIQEMNVILEDVSKKPLSDIGAGTVVYNEDGTIKTVLFNDGNKLNYSYEYDAKGNLKECSIESGYYTYKLSIGDGTRGGEDQTGSGQGSLPKLVAAVYSGGYLGNKEGPDEPKKGALTPTPVIVINIPVNDAGMAIKKLSKEPVNLDFEKVKKAIEKTTELNKDALKDYEIDTSPYYYKVGKAIKGNAHKLKNKSGMLDKCLVSISNSGVTDAQLRSAVDESIVEIRRMADDGVIRDHVAVGDILGLESMLKDRLVNPAREVYEGRVQQAVDYANAMVDMLMSSPLAIYLNANKERIDVVINLPKPPQNTK